jgi:hypothetical protein
MKDETVELVDFLLAKKLTANQFVFLYLKHKGEDQRLYRYLETVRPLFKEEIFDLEERGFIINVNSPSQYWADNYIVSNKFSKIIDPDVSLAEEFWNTYPGFCDINGSRAPLKGIAKDDFLHKYAVFVQKNSGVHQRIMQALRYQKGNDDVKMRIDRWFDAHTWESVEQDLKKIKRTVYGQKEI